MSNTYYKSKTVLITGGAQGIGLGMAEAFTREGAAVIITDVDQEAGKEAVKRLQQGKGNIEFILCDVSAEHEVVALMEKVGEKYGLLDVLVNNAGIADPFMGNLQEMLMSEFDKIMAVNLRGPVMCAKYSLPLLKKSGYPVILNISSTRAFMSEPNTFAYSASKGGLEALTHSLAISLAVDRIRVNAIAPGWIETGDWQKKSQKYKPQHSKEDKEQHPVGRVGTPEDIAEAALYLCSAKAGFITGQSITIDGGMTVKMIYK
ncbi:NAD(P)-dependent dehydrogenase (short-subunit alcohol dehydrogenase family) [Pontibacter aydingkolensis]|uniref:Glucose 1-dehydrogenase n=1 Tax=Pontibacter aydingkolensis TaxID=1911536 RepID=A0ABS7CWI9_9BACT|nr:glucose 1-dehydrogenase [Pontibacter aydingkolensis]MBW7468061.1 glucose 1-dehydrogenase [Pontibacter aydingkolensis]